MYSKKIENYKKTLKLTKRQREIVFGLLLGDGCLETQNNGKTYRLKVEQSNQHKEYVDWLYKELKPFVLTIPKTKQKKLLGKTHINYGFQTLSIGGFRFFSHQFYGKNDGQKRIPKLIRRYLSPLSIAVWFMDDGQAKSEKHRTLLINTQCFTKKDLRLLQKALLDKFEIKTTLHKEKNGWRMYFVSSTIDKFLYLIELAILPSMKYKLGRINNMPKL